MAKSFHTIISEGTIDVLHRGEEVTFELPEWIQELKGKLFDEEALLEWAKEYEVTVPVFHYFVKELLIAVRAVARPSVDTKTDKSDSMIETSNKCQDRINEFILKEIPEPGQSKAKVQKDADDKACIKAVNAMMDNDIDGATVHKILDKDFDKLTVAKAINNYEE